MNRLYVVESMPSGTGAIADHRLSMRSGEVAAFAGAVAARMDERFQPFAARRVPERFSSPPVGRIARDRLNQMGV